MSWVFVAGRTLKYSPIYIYIYAIIKYICKLIHASGRKAVFFPMHAYYMHAVWQGCCMGR